MAIFEYIPYIVVTGIRLLSAISYVSIKLLMKYFGKTIHFEKVFDNCNESYAKYTYIKLLFG